MKRGLLFTGLFLYGFVANAQVTWSEQAAEVFYNNCTACHNSNGIAPMSLMTYDQAVTYAPLIQTYVNGGIMPPWTADTAYQHYAGERVLTQAEKDIILDWINDGTPEGDTTLAPPPPVYNGDQVLPGTPDLVITAPNYMSKAVSGNDDYVCFAIPSGLTSNRKVKAFEVIPGNRQTVHHCLVYFDNAGWAVTDTSGNCAGPVTATLMGGYTPGSTPIIFPSTADFSTGMEIGAGAEIVLAMHYPAGSYGTWDQTKVNFYFYDEPVNNFRTVSCEPIIEDWSFTIAANTFDSVHVANAPTPDDYTMLSVFPHMHLIGDYIESWGITPSTDTLKFARIPLWDFDWQDFYWFNYMKHIPSGTVIHGKGKWNNTVSNPHNPNNPPQDISAGLNTTDEMFLIYYHYMLYQTGDELLNVDSLNGEFLALDEMIDEEHGISAYPNPFDNYTSIHYQLDLPSYVSIFIYDVQGRLVKKLVQVQQMAGNHNILWDGKAASGKEVQNGIYVYSVMINGKQYSGKLIKR